MTSLTERLPHATARALMIVAAHGKTGADASQFNHTVFGALLRRGLVHEERNTLYVAECPCGYPLNGLCSIHDIPEIAPYHAMSRAVACMVEYGPQARASAAASTE